MSTTISHVEVKARKNHSCDWCCAKIEVGEVYNKQTFTYDGSILTWKSHLSCISLATELNWFDECDEGLTESDFYENVIQKYMSVMSEEFNEAYESPDFVDPPFLEQLQFLKDKYLC